MHQTATVTDPRIQPPLDAVDPDSPSLGVLAYRAYTAHRLDFEGAVNALERELHNNAALLRTLLRQIARNAIREAAGRYRREFSSLRPDEDKLYEALPRDVKAALPTPASGATAPKHVNGMPTPEHQRDLRIRALSLIGRSWLHCPLAFHSGTLLGDATRPMLLEVANRYRRSSESDAKNAKRYAAIAKRLPDDTTTVAQALNENQISLIMGGAR